MKRTRILFINPNSEIGGSDVSLLRLLRCLDGTRYEAIVGLPFPGPLVPEFEMLGARVLYLSVLPIKRFRSPWEALSFVALSWVSLWRLRGEIRRLDPDVVHLNSLVLLVPALAARLAGKKIAWHAREIIHGPRWISWALTRASALIAARIFAISSAVAARFPRWAEQRIEIVYNGIDVERFDPERVDGAALRRELRIPDDAPVIGFVGRLVPWKGADRFLLACAGIAQQFPQARFLVVGSTLERYEGYARKLEALAKQLGLQNQIAFLYRRRDVAEILAGMDVFVHASVQPEPFGLVIIEAMAMGRAVVATRGGGVPEIIDSPDLGELVQPGDVDGMVRAVIALLRDPERRRRLGSAARQKAVREFDIRLETRQIERIYLQLLESRGGRR